MTYKAVHIWTPPAGTHVPAPARERNMSAILRLYRTYQNTDWLPPIMPSSVEDKVQVVKMPVPDLHPVVDRLTGPRTLQLELPVWR